MRCYRRILHISHKDHANSEEVRAKIQQAVGPCEDLLTIVKRRKLQWYGHRHSEVGKKTRQTEAEVGRQHQGMHRPGVRQVPEGSGEKGKMEETGCEVICVTPTTLVVKGLIMMMMMMRSLIRCSFTCQCERKGKKRKKKLLYETGDSRPRVH